MHATEEEKERARMEQLGIEALVYMPLFALLFVMVQMWTKPRGRSYDAITVHVAASVIVLPVTSAVRT